jgi:signal transduction histidine kinase
MRNKIAVKFFLSVAVALLTFSILVVSSFGYLFNKHVVMVREQDMEQRAERIAQALGESRDQWILFQKNRQREDLPKDEDPKEFQNRTDANTHLPVQGPRAMGFNAVLRFLGSTAAEDVWIIDEHHYLEITGKDRTSKPPSFLNKELPPEAEQVVKKVLLGEKTTSHGFSEMLKVPTLTVGVPVKDKDANIIGAVLIHAPISGMDVAVAETNRILLMCGGIALIVAFLIALYFAWRFTKPLKIMQKTAEFMTDGDYNVRCNIKQKDEIGELARALDSLGARLLVASQESAKLDKLRKDFIANISHELRTPVTVIRGSLEALSDGLVTTPEKVNEYYQQMLSETLFLQRLINDLLDLSRLQNTDFKIEMTKINLCDILQDVAHNGQRMARDKNIKVVLQMDKNCYTLEGDYGRLRQMLMVFIDNGIKFSPSDSSLEIELKDRLLTVTDHGCGVEAEALPHIFDRFYKTRNERNKTGTGLGLAIAREIAQRHGMKVHMESQPNVKTSVVIDLPAEEQTEKV